MGVYVKDMEMPKEGFVEILIRDDGTVQQTGQSYRIDGTDYYTPYVGEMPTIYKAIPVPPHGDLISRETAKLYHSYLVDERTDIRVPAIPLSVLNVVPTIIPADPAEEG